MKYIYMLTALIAALLAALSLMAGLFHQETGHGLPWGLALALLAFWVALGLLCSGRAAAIEEDEAYGLNSPRL